VLRIDLWASCYKGEGGVDTRSDFLEFPETKDIKVLRQECTLIEMETLLGFFMGAGKRCSSRLVGMSDERKGEVAAEPLDDLERLHDDILGFLGELGINKLFGTFPDFGIFTGLKPDLLNKVHVRTVNHGYKGLIIRPFRQDQGARDRDGCYALMKVEGQKPSANFHTSVFEMQSPLKCSFVGWRHVNIDNLIQEAKSHESDKRKWIRREGGGDCIIVPPNHLNNNIQELDNALNDIDETKTTPKWATNFSFSEFANAMTLCFQAVCEAKDHYDELRDQ
jgi:hypothetical protein